MLGGNGIPNINIEAAHRADPSKSQNLFPFIFTNTNINAIAERSFTTPNTPVKKRDEETEVNPADMKITGASAPPKSVFNTLKLAGSNTYNSSTHSNPPYSEQSSTLHPQPTVL